MVEVVVVEVGLKMRILGDEEMKKTYLHCLCLPGILSRSGNWSKLMSEERWEVWDREPAWGRVMVITR